MNVHRIKSTEIFNEDLEHIYITKTSEVAAGEWYVKDSVLYQAPYQSFYNALVREKVILTNNLSPFYDDIQQLFYKDFIILNKNRNITNVDIYFEEGEKIESKIRKFSFPIPFAFIKKCKEKNIFFYLDYSSCDVYIEKNRYVLTAGVYPFAHIKPLKPK